MAQGQLMQVKLSRFDAQPWGFRLQGGVDFAAPLLVQKVNAGGLAEQAGLIPGDAVLKINDVDVFNLRHKDAQDIVVRSGNNFVITIQRGGSTWRPHVTPTGQMPQPNQNSPYLQTVTKTSLAHKQQESQHIGCGYNNAARPFANGGDGSVKSIVNKQYNTPVGIYSDESIAETLSAQAEVLAGGVLGVNFKKNEKEYQAEKSEVLKFLREEETGGNTPAYNNHPYQEPQQQQQHYQQQPPQQQQHYQQQQQHQHQHLHPHQHQHQHQQQHQQAATRHVTAPINTPKPPSTGGLPTGQNICQECERLITGVFVRIKDKNLHVECFKCATCGTSLKNQGYYNFNNKLYCDIHAKLAAMQNPPTGTEGYVPVPIKPNTKLSATTISSALSAHGFNNGYSNGGSSTPTPAPLEEAAAAAASAELPLPPPPSPTQLQQFENDSQYGHNNHTRTNSSLSSMSTGSNQSSMSPVPTYPLPLALGEHNAYMPTNSAATTASTLSLDHFASPQHSRQASSSSSSLGMLDMHAPPPPPPPPMPLEASHALHTSHNKNHINNSNTKMLQQHVAGRQQNENDMNTHNKSATGVTPPTQTNKVYNKFLKEYSNKLLTQNNNNNNNNNNECTTQNEHNNSSSISKFNDTAKPFTLTTKAPANNITTATTATTATNKQPNVAAISATLANQLKFNPCQVANPLATTTVTTLDNNNIVSDINPSTNCNSNNNSHSSNIINNSNSNMLSAVADEQATYGQTSNGAASTVQSAAPTASGDKPFEYVTLTGNVIRSVVPPGKGANLSYKVNQGGYARPYGAAPPAAAPKSPVSYPPQQQQQQWNAPKSPVGANAYATLPRSNVGQQGRRRVQSFNSHYNNSYSSNNHATQYRKPQAGPNKYATMPSYNTVPHYSNYSNSSSNYNTNSTNNYYNKEPDDCLQPQYAEEQVMPAGAEYFEEDHEVSAANRQSRANFAWPPLNDDRHDTPTAAPLYIPPPETQHIVAKPLQEPPPALEQLQEHALQQHHYQQQQQPVVQEAQPQQLQQAPQPQAAHWQSLSAPQLTGERLQPPEIESSSESFTSTCTTTTTTSEEYQRMYAAQVQAYQMQQAYEQSGSELDYHMEMELAAMQDSQQQDDSYLSSGEYLSGRRSVQECVESLSAPLSNYKLIDMVREVTPSPVPQQPSAQGPRRVVFVDEPEVKEVTQPELAAEPSTQEEATYAPEEYQLQPQDEEDEEKGLIIEDRSHILESQRIFQPTPEIKIEIAPVRHIPPTKIPNPTPKEWINPMVRALTTASEVPFHLVECPCPKPCDCNFAACEEAQTNAAPPLPPAEGPPIDPATIERPPSPEPEFMRESPPCGTRLTKAMATAPEFPMRFLPPALEGIPLPEDTEPYMPPPIDMKPYLREDYRPKSPFLSALTTAPERPFEGHFDRDVPIHLIDLPTPKEHLTMAYALRTASDRAYTPLNPENAMHKFEEEEKEKEKKKYEFQVLDREKELGITVLGSEAAAEAVEYYTTEKRNSTQRKSSAFAAMQAFQPSREPLATTPSTPRNSVISLAKDEPDLDYQKYCKAKERNQKRLDYLHKKEEEIQQQQTQTQQQTNTCETSSLSSSCNKQSYSSNSSSAVQQMSNNTTTTATTYAFNSAQASRSAFSAAYGASASTDPKADMREIIEETADELEHSEVLFPPPSPLSHLKAKAVSSGLHKADSIPKYQRNWTVLPTQSPIRTPEPQELRENIPLAFVDAPKTPTAEVSSACNPVHKPVAQMSSRPSNASSVHQQHQQQSTAAAARGSISSTTSVRQQQPSSQPKLSVPIIIEDRSGPVTMAFQSLDEHMQPDQSQTPTRAYTPSLTNKPAPIIPFYQTPEKLCFDECPAMHARAYDRRSASPFPDRARSPAPGPPPNPLSAIRAPRMKENELSPLSPRVLQAGSITTGQSYLGAQQAQQQGQTLAHFESSSQSGMQSYTEKPEKFEEHRVGDRTIQKREKESHLAEQKQSQLQSQTTTQIGNTQVERRRKVTEEFEHTQSAKTIEIRTGSASSTERRQSYGKTGYVANQARRLSGLEQEITNLTSQSQAISARAANLTDTTFPQLTSPEPTSKFPLKPVFPPHDEPAPPSYVLSSSASKAVAGPPPGFLQQQQQQKQVSTAYGASLVSLQQQQYQQLQEHQQHQQQQQYQQQQQQKSLSAFSSTSTTNTSSCLSSQANAVSCCLTKASATNTKQACTATAAGAGTSSGAGGICPVTGTFCRPGHTCCKQQHLQTQRSAAGSYNNNLNNNNAYRPNASAGLPDAKPASATASAAAPKAPVTQSAPASAPARARAPAPAPAPAVAPSVSDNINNGGSSGGVGGKGVFGATSAPKRGRGILNKAVTTGVRVPLCNSCGTQISDDATAMLTESIGKINMGHKMDNFMAEAGKIITNMLEARLANNGGALSNSGSTLSLRSNSSSNLSKSPMVVRKRFELEDFKDVDPTEPVSLKPVVALQQQITLSPHAQKAQPQVAKGVASTLATEMPLHHPMSKVLEMCDSNRAAPNGALPKPLATVASKSVAATADMLPPPPLLPVSAVPTPALEVESRQQDVLAPMQTVVYRNKSDNPNKRANQNGVLSTHAMDRRSYIEPQGENIMDGPAFSVCVKALGGPESDANAPMTAENEEVVSQLLKDGKRPICCQCNNEITKGPFITALGKIWCPEHFICVNGNCRRPLQDIGFVEEKGDLYCEYCFEKYLAPTCSKCGSKIKGDCLNAIGKQFHPECFTCAHCGKLFGNTPFFLEDGNAYCEADWNELFTTKCFACGFPVEAGDRWVEALNHNYHSQCFNCTYCKQNLEGQSFYNKGGRPFCKNHAR